MTGTTTTTEGTETGTQGETNTSAQTNQQATNGAPAQLPEDHPLVTSMNAMKAQIKELKASKGELDQIKASQQTDVEKLTARAETAEQAHADLRGRYHGLLKSQAITTAASQANAVNTKAVAALIRDDVTVDDDGTVKGVDKAIKALQDSDPDLFNTTPAGTNDAGAGRRSITIPDTIQAGTPRLAAAFDQRMANSRK